MTNKQKNHENYLKHKPYSQEYGKKYRKIHRSELVEYSRKYYQEHKKELCKRANVNRRKRPHIQRERDLNKSFWTLDLYEKTCKKQRQRCAICRKRVKGNLTADHDHKSNTPRGLLCSPCNFALGLLKDKSKLVEAAAVYLRKWGK